MMRVFSSRRESITADLRTRAARFEPHYGRKPSRRAAQQPVARLHGAAGAQQPAQMLLAAGAVSPARF